MYTHIVLHAAWYRCGGDRRTERERQRELVGRRRQLGTQWSVQAGKEKEEEEETTAVKMRNR